jgi:pentatricopeptide repeat protein
MRRFLHQQRRRCCLQPPSAATVPLRRGTAAAALPSPSPLSPLLRECDASARAALASGDHLSALGHREALQRLAAQLAVSSSSSSNSEQSTPRQQQGGPDQHAASEQLLVRAYGNAMVTCCVAAERLLQQSPEASRAAAAALEGALELFEDLSGSGLRADVRCANAALRATLLLGRRTDAQELFEALFRTGHGLDAGRAPQRLEPDSFSFNMAISACRSSDGGGGGLTAEGPMQRRKRRGERRWSSRGARDQTHAGAEEALRLVAEMERRHDERKAVAATTTTTMTTTTTTTTPKNDALSLEAYGSAMGVLCESPACCEVHWRDALGLLDRMRRRAIDPDARAIGSALVACGWAGEWEEAMRLLSLASKAHQAALDRRRPTAAPATKPAPIATSALAPALDVSVCAAALNACARATPPQWGEALRLLRAMEASAVPSPATSAPKRTGAPLQQQTRRSSPTPTAAALLPRPDVRCYSIVMNAFSRDGQWERAVSLLDEIETRNVVATNHFTYAAVISACAKQRRARSAGGFSGGERFPGGGSGKRRRSGSRAEMEVGSERARWFTALRLLERMEKRRGLVPDDACYIAAIAACSGAGQWQDAISVLERMEAAQIEDASAAVTAGTVSQAAVEQRRGALVSAFGHAMAACARFSRTRLGDNAGADDSEVKSASDDALRLLARLSAQHGVDPSPRMLLAVLEAAAAAGAWQASLGLLKQFVSEARSRRTAQAQSQLTAAYAAAVRACDAAGQPRVALALLDSMMMQGSTGRAANSTEEAALGGATAPASARQPPIAPEPDLATFNVAISAAGVAGAWKRVLGLYRDLRRAQLTGDSTTFRSLAAALSANGRQAECDSCYCEAVASGVVWPWIDPSDSNTMDLHGLSAPLAQAALRVTLGDMSRRFEAKRRSAEGSSAFSSFETGHQAVDLHRLVPSPTRDLVLITGAAANRGPLGSPTLGKGSVLQPALKEAVGSLVEELNKQLRGQAADGGGSSDALAAQLSLRLVHDGANPGRLSIPSASLVQFLRTCDHWGLGSSGSTPLLRDVVGSEESCDSMDSASWVHQSASSMKRLRQIQRLKSQLTMNYDPFQPFMK